MNHVLLKLQGHVFYPNFHLLPVCGYDAVLGAEWLRSLGVISWDFNHMTMQFHHGTQQILLTGLHSSVATVKDSSEFHQLLLQQRLGFYIHLMHLQPASPTVQDPAVSSLLQQYSSIFAQPHGLPPVRCQDHQIQLLPGSTPPNVRP